MHTEIRLLIFAAFVALVAACTSSPTREPQAVKPEYNPVRVALLKTAAQHGLLFQISDAVIRDVPLKDAGEKCRRTSEGPWVEKVYSTLEVLDREPALLEKIHVVEFRRGDAPKAEISKDLDGATTLLISYSKSETRERINTLSDIPCSDGDMSLIGKEMTVTDFKWPVPAEITSVLYGLPDRPQVDRFDFDRRFPAWLADRMAMFRLTPEIAFEKTPTGQPLLVTALARLSEEVTTNPNQKALEFWMKEISSRSHLGASVKFFGLTRDLQMSTGLHVDSVGKFARKMNGLSDPTYPYVSYKLESGSYITGSLGQLGSCLNEFMSTYRSPMSSMNMYDMDPDSFLFPGHSCQAPGSSGE